MKAAHVSRASGGTVLMIPGYFDGLPRTAGSARIRAEWIARHWPACDLFDGSQRLGDYRLIICQKVYKGQRAQDWIRAVARWREDGGRYLLALDLCDPDFLDPEHARRLLSVLHLFDFATAPTEALGLWLGQSLPAYMVRDRVDLCELGDLRATYSRRKRPRCVWFGYAHNAVALDGLRDTIMINRLPLTIIAERMPAGWERVADFVRWDRAMVNEEIVKADVVLNPLADAPEWMYKSDNKTTLAWALGIPVATTPGDLERLMLPSERAREGKLRWGGRADHDVTASARRWHQIAEAWQVLEDPPWKE